MAVKNGYHYPGADHRHHHVFSSVPLHSLRLDETYPVRKLSSSPTHSLTQSLVVLNYSTHKWAAKPTMCEMYNIKQRRRGKSTTPATWEKSDLGVVGKTLQLLCTAGCSYSPSPPTTTSYTHHLGCHRTRPFIVCNHKWQGGSSCSGK